MLCGGGCPGTALWLSSTLLCARSLDDLTASGVIAAVDAAVDLGAGGGSGVLAWMLRNASCDDVDTRPSLSRIRCP